MQFSVVLVSLFALAVSAAPAEIQKRSTTCGSTTYSTAQVNAASNAACTHVKAGTVAGSSTYPHRYNNYEGFDFDVTGPWYEFPIKTSGVYTGGELSPIVMCDMFAWCKRRSSGIALLEILNFLTLHPGSPGADRVVINASCGQAGQITHTGASGNNFVGCSGTS
ncbi:ribonuclease [Colletotrichum fioriniae PJ7]|uniref:ribonuclease T1 n=1 Tax=Colletotrichum fioriniae PJ7 TaxID=1445577 RepID=A0A010QZY1_9PEZI|nr:ribonuclease [Colletotrichum fioriniae PJ7]